MSCASQYNIQDSGTLGPYITHLQNIVNLTERVPTHLQQYINSHCVLKSRSSFPIRGKVNQRLYVCREYLMYYRVPGLFAIVCFGSYPLSRQQVVSLPQPSRVSPVELTDRRGRIQVGVGAKSYDGEKAWSSINHALLCIYVCRSACHWLPIVQSFQVQAGKIIALEKT